MTANGAKRFRRALTFSTALAAFLAFPETLRVQEPPARKESAAAAMALTHVNVVDVRAGNVRRNQTVVVQGSRIVAAGPSNEVKAPPNAILMDCQGLFVMPGLWDMHVHLVFGDWFPEGKLISLPLFVANGVTGVRDMGSDLDQVQAWQREIAAGRLLGPRIYTPGPMLDGPKPRFPSSLAIAAPEDGRRAVDELQRRGADFIKLQSLIRETPSLPSPRNPGNRASHSKDTCRMQLALPKCPTRE